MRWQNTFRFLVLCTALFVAVEGFAQTPAVDLGPLPASLSPEQRVALSNLAPSPRAEGTARAVRHRRYVQALPQLTPQQMEYREAVRALGTDMHQFVHVELTDGNVQTGAITSIDDGGFQLRDGIFASKRIDYRRLKEKPRHVPAVGTHIANGLKWGSFVVLAIPAIVLLLPLVVIGVIPDC